MRWLGTSLALVGIVLLAAPAPAYGGDNTVPWARKNSKKPSNAAGARTAPAGQTSRAANPQAAKDAFEMHASGRMEFHARQLDVADALAQLRQLTRRNIIVSPDVRATFTGDLYDVTLHEVLAAIARTTGLTVREEAPFIYVELAGIETRLFRLDYVRAADVVELLKPLVGPKGQLTATLASQRGIQPSDTDAGSDDLAGADVVLAVDEPKNLARIAEAIRALDVRPRQVLIEATILSSDVQNDRSLGVEFTSLAGIDFNGMSAVSPGGTGVELGDVPGNGFDSGTATGLTNLLDGLPTTGLNFGILKNSVGVFVRALQEVTRTTVLASPKVLALNKQKGEVIIGRRDGYLTTTVTQTASIQNVEFLETGTRLLFRPFISSDGYVRLEIHPEDSNGGINSDGLPMKDTAEVTTNILVRDGETVVIGGLFRERRDATRRKVPGLGDLPGAGALFRSDDKDYEREEIIILLTPRILSGPAAQEGERPEPTLGARRLVDSYLAQARSMIAAGPAAGAASLLDAAHELQPGHPEIRRLRRQIAAPPMPLASNRAVDQRILDRVQPAPATPVPAPSSVERPAALPYVQPTTGAGKTIDQRILDQLAPPPQAGPPQRPPVPPPPPPPAWPADPQRVPAPPPADVPPVAPSRPSPGGNSGALPLPPAGALPPPAAPTRRSGGER